VSWASRHIADLQAGRTVVFRPHGNSMQGRVESGQLCTVAPLEEPPVPGDVVLCKVNGAQYLHLVKAVQGDRVQIGNNKGRINGWTSRKQIYGKLVKVE
jgi:phage repressor protein C with HTH and peptisase S24 domain